MLNAVNTYIAIHLNRHRVARRLAVLLACCVLLVWLHGCQSPSKVDQPPPTIERLKITNQVGGTHHRLLVNGDWWYQTFNDRLLVINPKNARIEHELRLAEAGMAGAAVDMVAHEGGLLIVLEDDGVVEIDLSDPARPTVVRRVDRYQLGIRPRRLSTVNRTAYVCGVGGAVRWNDRKTIASTDASADAAVRDVVRVQAGLAVCRNRRVYSVATGTFLGAASELEPLSPTQQGLPERFAFVRQLSEGAFVGLMNRDVREVDANDATTIVQGIVRSLRVIAGDIWVVTDREILKFTTGENQLNESLRINVRGARDVGVLDDNYLAVAGTFGRAIYRINDDARGEGDTFVFANREPSRLGKAISDGRSILAGSDEGIWLYRIGSEARLVQRQLQRDPPQQSRVEFVTEMAQINDDQRSITMTDTSGHTWTHTEPEDVTIHCLAGVEGNLWMGHDRGITVVKIDRVQGGEPEIERLRLPGPILYLFPLRLGDGAAYVSEFGGFGVVRMVSEPVDRTGRTDSSS